MKPFSSFHSIPGLEVERGQAADRGAIVAEMVLAGRQGDLRAQVRGRDLEAEIAVMLGHHPVHVVGEDDVGLAGGEAGLDQLLEQRAGIDRCRGLDAVLGAACSAHSAPVAHRFHERVGDQHAVVQVQRLAVEVARGLADLEELLDLGVRDVEIAGGRAAAQRPRRDREGQPDPSRGRTG